MSVGGNVTSSPAATHCLWTSSASATHTDIHAPLSAVSSPPGPNVAVFAPRPRPPCPPWQRKISHSPEPTAPNVGGVPQSQSFFQPHFSNHAKLAAMSDTFRIGVTAFAFMVYFLLTFRRSDPQTFRRSLESLCIHGAKGYHLPARRQRSVILHPLGLRGSWLASTRPT